MHAMYASAVVQAIDHRSRGIWEWLIIKDSALNLPFTLSFVIPASGRTTCGKRFRISPE